MGLSGFKMITAQSVTGTGVISEISSSWSDLFGGQSDRLSNKLQSGENICMNKLRGEAARLGANAIIATDIDYAEVGGDKGMLMVCMAGTAVKLNNTDILGETTSANLEKLQSVVKNLRHYTKYDSVIPN